MRLLDTHNLKPYSLGTFDEYQVYNGLDSCITLEIYNKLPQKDNEVYRFGLALQAPIIEMMLRGILVDDEARKKMAVTVAAKIYHYEELLDYLGESCELPPRKMKTNKKKISAGDFDARYLNARSGPQLKAFFYGYLGIPEIRIHKDGESSVPMDEEILDKLKEYALARPIASMVLEIRSLQEQLKRLRGDISSDGRAHTTYGIAGTTTGRLNSTGWHDDTSWNLQNIAEELRHIFIADKGWKMCSIDKEQAESRMVGFICGSLFDKWKYLDFCEQRDVHTHFVRLVWPEINWTGNDKEDKERASDKKLVPASYGLSPRDKCKRIGHGANYYGTDKTLAENVYLPVSKVKEAKEIYFREFSEILDWQKYIIELVKKELPVPTPFGWQRRFYGYPNSSSTWREAIAYGPQSAIAHMTNLGLYRTWKHFGFRIRLLLQNHDNIVFLYREDDNEDEIVREALRFFEVPLTCRGRTMTIPGEAYVGWNWGYRKEIKNDDGSITIENERGLIKWKEKLDR